MLRTAQAVFTQPVYGNVTFTQEDDNPVKVSFHIIGAPNGVHAVHVHTGTDNCHVGGHFSIEPVWSPENPSGLPHGRIGKPRHTGDLCNNIHCVDGLIEHQYTDQLISLCPGDPANVVGMFVVIHEGQDDGGEYEQYADSELRDKSRVTGNAGALIAYAEIKYV